MTTFHQQQTYYIEEILEQPIFLSPYNTLNFSSNNSYYYRILPKNITDKFTTIRDLCRFHQPGLFSYMRFEEKLFHTLHNSKIIYIYVMNLILNDWKRTVRKENSQKFLWKVSCFKNKCATKIKNLQNLFNKEPYFILQSKTYLLQFNINYIKTFKFISLLNFIEGYQILSPGIWGKVFTDWFLKCPDCHISFIWYKFAHFSLPSNPAINGMGNSPNNPGCRGHDESHSIASCLKLP